MNKGFSNKLRKFRGSEQGVYLIITVAFIATLVLLAILIVGLGFRSGDTVLLQNNANLVSLSAIEGYVSSPKLVYSEKIDDALARANYILKENSIKGTAGAEGLGTIKHFPLTPERSMEFGVWYETKPKLSDPCNFNPNGGDLYPCFVSNLNNPAPTTANAVRVRLSNPNTNPILAPIVGTIGTVSAQSFAIMVPRCVANVVDVSYSVVTESHPENYELVTNVDGNGAYLNPADHPGPFAFRQDLIRPCSNFTSLYDPTDPAKMEQFNSSLFWCNLDPTRGSDQSPLHHYKSDYGLEQTPFGPMYIDKYSRPNDAEWGPQPFHRFLSAMNSGLRLIKKSTTPGDKALLMGFNSKIAGQVPNPLTNPTGAALTNEIDYLVQLTNPNNLGKWTWAGAGYSKATPLYPNYLNAGLVPVYARDNGVTSGTNLILAILKAMEAISDKDQCDEISKKSIIVATDGIGNCHLTGPDPFNENDYSCDNTQLSFYNAQENYLLHQVLDELLNRKISVTFLISGKAVGPHYLDIKDPNISPGNGLDFLNFEEARSQGYGSDINDPALALFHTSYKCPTAVCSEEEALQKSGRPGYEFRRPLGALGQIAVRTGGMICPLLEQCTPSQCVTGCSGGSCYQPDPAGGPNEVLRDCARSPGAEQKCSYYNISKSAQAALCATQAVGGNPFALRQPANIR